MQRKTLLANQRLCAKGIKNEPHSDEDQVLDIEEFRLEFERIASKLEDPR